MALPDAKGIAMLGDAVSVAPFSSLGVRPFLTSTPEEMRHAFEEVIQGDFAVLLLTEKVYEVLERKVSQRIEEVVPAITVIPGATGVHSVGSSRIDAIIERALGTSLLTQGHPDDTDEKE